MKQKSSRIEQGRHIVAEVHGRNHAVEKSVSPSAVAVGLSASRRVLDAFRCLVACLALSVALTGVAHAAAVVTTHKDENGWRLKVNGEDFFVKGVVWGYTPRNENYTYNLWGESDDFIRKVLDYEFGLMAAAGVNTIRSFSMIPPEWITYIYQEHGIMSVVNPLMGRYGYTVGGKWVPFTDYSDPLTREVLKADTLEIIEKYKNTPGVLMFALGNESNYGLSWSSFEIENLPEGEQNTAKARYLYSLFGEVIAEGQKIAPNHPFSIVNGDIQYIDLIAEYLGHMDILGSNVYRGKSFTNLWEEVDKKLDMPVVFFEFGSDAYNARTSQEDQLAQAEILKYQWQEMYNKSWGNGEEGNAIGGYVFEWRDEWWKYLQVERLDIQDTNASWSNQAYPFDWAEGKNNMNEEWFGITALGKPNSDGVYEARPRMAYDVLSEIWALDPYAMKKVAINQSIDEMNMEYLALKSDVRMLKSDNKEAKQILHFTGGRLEVQMLLKGTEQGINEQGDFGDEFSNGEMVFLDFGFNPAENIEGQFSVNILGNVADTEPLELQYGRRGQTVVVQGFVPVGGVVPIETDIQLRDRERVEIYDFSAEYRSKFVDLEAFYHTPRYHWGYEGDFFGLIRETTDMEGQDIWNAKAPRGVEFDGKEMFEGLKVLVGPEVYWGANPKAVVKYSNSFAGIDWTFIHSEDLDRANSSASATAETEVETRQTTLYAATELPHNVKLEVGGIIGSSDKIDDEYTRFSDGEIRLDEIDFEDTLGLKTKISFPMPFLGYNTYFATHHAGLVADGGAPLREFGTRLPYSEYGNKREYEAGMMITHGDWLFFPRFLYRENYEDANNRILPSFEGGEFNPGLAPRNRDDDPFAVLDNREARAYELFTTWDPTGATPFYDWDNDMREDAKFAFNVGLNYTEFKTKTDSFQFFFEPESTNAAFGVGLPAEDTWEVSSRMVYNPTTNWRLIGNVVGGYLQSTGDPDGGTREFYELDGKVVFQKKHILEFYAKYNAFGPYDFHRQFNITFPYQYRLDYSILLDQLRDERKSTKIGIRGLLRGVDENSPTEEFLDGDNEYLWQGLVYFEWAF